MEDKPKLVLISGTAARLEDFEKSGFLNRQKRLIKEYVNHFEVEYYTSDIENYSSVLQVKHYPLPFHLRDP